MSHSESHHKYGGVEVNVNCQKELVSEAMFVSPITLTFCKIPFRNVQTSNELLTVAHNNL